LNQGIDAGPECSAVIFEYNTIESFFFAIVHPGPCVLHIAKGRGFYFPPVRFNMRNKEQSRVISRKAIAVKQVIRKQGAVVAVDTPCPGAKQVKTPQFRIGQGVSFPFQEFIKPAFAADNGALKNGQRLRDPVGIDGRIAKCGIKQGRIPFDVS
jgi:hypothetical protein